MLGKNGALLDRGVFLSRSLSSSLLHDYSESPPPWGLNEISLWGTAHWNRWLLYSYLLHQMILLKLPIHAGELRELPTYLIIIYSDARCQRILEGAPNVVRHTGIRNPIVSRSILEFPGLQIKCILHQTGGRQSISSWITLWAAVPSMLSSNPFPSECQAHRGPPGFLAIRSKYRRQCWRMLPLPCTGKPGGTYS